MNIYQNSTQNKNWIFKKPDLDLMQVSKFERGLKILAELNRDLNKQIHSVENKEGINENKPTIKVLVNLKSKL